MVKLDPINPTTNKETAVINNTNDNENTETTTSATDNDSDYHIMTNKKFVSDIQFNKGISERKIRWVTFFIC